MKHITTILGLLLITCSIWSQSKPQLSTTKNTERDPSLWTINADQRISKPKLLRRTPATDVFKLSSVPQQLTPSKLSYQKDPATGQVIGVTGTIPNVAKTVNLENAVLDYIDYARELFQIKSADESIQIMNKSKDDLGITNLRLQQYHQGYKIMGAEAVALARDGKIQMLTGRLIPDLDQINMKIGINEKQVESILQADLPSFKKIEARQLQYIPHEQIKSELVINNIADDNYTLDYAVTIYPTIAVGWQHSYKWDRFTRTDP